MHTTHYPVEPEDIPHLKEFMARVIDHSIVLEEPIYSAMVANVSSNVDWWLEHRDDAVHIKALIGQQLVGVVLVKSFWNLCSLFVEPSVQRRGIGHSLLVAAIAACKSRSPKQAIWLNASPTAIAFYRAHGFRPRASSQPLPPGFLPMELPL